MKRIVCLVLIFCNLQIVLAEEMTKALVVWSKDGNKVAYALSEKPKITFAKDSLVITTPNIEVSYQLSLMHHFTYEEQELTGVVDVNGNSVNPFTMNGDELLFYAKDQDRDVRIYTIDGRTIISHTIKSGTILSVSLINYNKGLYLVSVNGLTYKVWKR